MTCPFCAEEVPQGAGRCPACNEQVSSSRASSPRTVLIIVGVVLALGALGVCVLAALLVPALTRAKEKANRTRCSNNLRQIALGAIQYADTARFYPHVQGRADLDGDVHTSDTPRALRLVVNRGYLDQAEVFICPSSGDQAMREPITDAETWQWGGTEAAHGALDPLADDPDLDQTDELSYGWVRRSVGANARSTTLIAADRAVRSAARAPNDLLLGNHADGWNVALVDGTVMFLPVSADPFPGASLAKTEGPAEAAALAIKDQDDRAALR